VRLLLLIYFVCTRGALRCFFFFFNKIAIAYKKKKGYIMSRSLVWGYDP
jgi:hypothetical protein